MITDLPKKHNGPLVPLWGTIVLVREARIWYWPIGQYPESRAIDTWYRKSSGGAGI